MITDDGVEVHDIQQSEAGGGEDYTRPFGTPETKEEALGFLDPRIVIPPDWEIVRPSKLTRLKNWLHRHLYRPWQ